MIIEKLVVGPIEANCYVVADKKNKRGMVIDPGGDAESILESIRRLDLSIDNILLTHSHFDHVSAAGALKRATGAPILVHEADAGSLNDPFLIRLAGIVADKVPPPDRLLNGWENIMVGDFNFTVLHIPGHTPGGIALYGADVVFTGDSLFNQGIGRTDLPGGDFKQLIESLNCRLLVLDDDIKVYPGHGPDTTIGAERRGNPFLVNPPRKEC